MSALTITPTASSTQTTIATSSAGGRSSGSQRAQLGPRLLVAAAAQLSRLRARGGGGRGSRTAPARPPRGPRRRRSPAARTPAPRPRPAPRAQVAGVEPSDREERDGGVGGRVADQLEAHRRTAGLGGRLVHRADADVVDQPGIDRVDLLRAVGREADQHRPDRRSRGRPPAGRSSCPTWIPSAPDSAATPGRSLTISSAPSRAHSAAAAEATAVSSSSASCFSRSWTTSDPARDGRRGSGRGARLPRAGRRRRCGAADEVQARALEPVTTLCLRGGSQEIPLRWESRRASPED